MSAARRTARWTGNACFVCGAPTATDAPEGADLSFVANAVRSTPFIEWCTGTCLATAMELTPTLGDAPEDCREESAG